jgi:hypothetical protein
MRTLLCVTLAVLTFGCVRERIVYRDSPTTPAPATTPEPPSLRFPQGIPDAEIVIIPGMPTLVDVVNEETAALFPSCAIGETRCDGQGYDAQGFYYVLTARLRARGLWAGQHRDGQSDEITVALDCRGPWENYKQWIYLGYPSWAKEVESPCAGDACLHKGTSYRGNTLISERYCR